MDRRRQVYLIAAALIRRGDEVLLVRQQGPDDPEAAWALPGGVVEAGELLTEALAREVREETGLDVVDPGRIVYVAQFDNPLPEQIHKGAGPGTGYQATVFVFEVAGWRGEVCCADPDGFVMEACFLPLTEAIRRLKALPLAVMREPVLAYLRGQAPPGTVWAYRRQPDGSDMLVAAPTRDDGAVPGD